MIFTAIAYVFMLLASLANLSIPITYETFSTELESYPVTGYTLQLDMNDSNISINHGYSHDQFYGFEKTSEISNRHGAIAAINGMFYNEYGMPYGIMIEDGQVLGINTTGGPLLYMDENHIMHIEDVSIEAYVISGETKQGLWGVNVSAPQYAFVLYDSIYGRTNRIYRDSVNYLITDGVVVDIIETNSAVSTSESDYVLSHITPDKRHFFEIGDEVEFEYDYYLVDPISQEREMLDLEIVEAFQTGGWLVRDGENVAKDYEPYVGYTTSLHPRTLVGITEDNHLVLMVIDGRQDHSTGVTGRQAADFLIEAGCLQGGYMDGGASSTMVLNGNLMNSPSGGEERDVAHSILFHYNVVGVE